MKSASSSPPPPPGTLLHSSSGLRRLAVVTVSLPLFGFVYCIIYTFFYNFKNSTYTHCEVSNFAPSISASIGTKPQKYVWQFCVGLHSQSRFLFGFLACRHVSSRALPSPFNRGLSTAALLAQWAENLCLLTLTVVSSVENFTIHKMGFSGFCLFSVFHQCALVYLSSKGGYQPHTSGEARALRLRKSLLKTTAVSGVLMVYFYWRHNTYCEPYVYSFFCILEYTIVLCNMGFHVSVFYDLQFAEVTVSNSGGGGGAALQQKNGGGYLPLFAEKGEGDSVNQRLLV